MSRVEPKRITEGVAAQATARLVPVLRRRRTEWYIPFIEDHRVLQAELSELKHLEVKFRETTPIGRELFRSFLLGIRKTLGNPGTSLREVADYAKLEIAAFPSMEKEYKQQYVMGHSKDIDPGAITLEGMAITLAIREWSRKRLK